jgi:hypothetical protein
MKQMTSDKLREIALDITAELGHLDQLAEDVHRVQEEMVNDPTHVRLFYENLALKLHNFYTGCERVFRIIASEVNGAIPEGYDWHKRLLDRMAMEREGRPAVIALQTARRLEEYLSFRHVVRNIYSYELDPERIDRLVRGYPEIWQRFRTDVDHFIVWLRTLATQLEETAET